MTFTDSNWESEVLRADVPVLVDFWADGCGPCRMISPTIDALAEEYTGRAKVGKLKLEDNMRTAAKYKIRSVPTLLVLKGGDVVAQKVGALGKADLKKLLDQQL
jgi:thioredoxin 1